MSVAKLYLIPNLLGVDADINLSFPSGNKEIIKSIRHFAVEHIKDARRFLVKYGLKEKIDQSTFIELNKRSELENLNELLDFLMNGHSVGIISDAGCPGIADPGAQLVELAHQNKIDVIPLIGPSSILLALISSGFNGQSFTFHGYLDRDQSKRKKTIQELESNSRRNQSTQLFMETPYRNEALFEDLIAELNDKTKLCLAVDISLKSAFIRSKSIRSWKTEKKPSIHKRPAIFLISA